MVKGAASEDDEAFLLKACSGDRGAVDRCLQRERERFPDFDEAQLYRRAIRTYFQEKGE